MHQPVNYLHSVSGQPIAERFHIELARAADEPKVEKLAYTYEEAAQALGVSESTIKRQAGLGKLDVVSIGRARRITVASINRLIDAATQSLNDQQGRTT